MLPVTQFAPEKNNTQGDAFIVLFELEYTDGFFLRYAKATSTIIFESVQWNPFPVSRVEMSQTMQGDIPAFDIAFSNVGREIQAILEFYEVEGRKGRIIVVHPSMLGDPTAKIEESFTVVSARADNFAAVLTVAPVSFDPFAIQLPREIVTPEKFPGVLGARARYLV